MLRKKMEIGTRQTTRLMRIALLSWGLFRLPLGGMRMAQSPYLPIFTIFAWCLIWAPPIVGAPNAVDGGIAGRKLHSLRTTAACE